MEVYHANQYIFNSCKRCRETTIWKESLYEATERAPNTEAPPPAPPPIPTVDARTRNERRHSRIRAKLKACIRFTQFDDEILEVTDVSRGGFGFITRKNLFQGWQIEVAIPYSQGSGNIFVPAKIVRVRPLPNQPLTEYGAAYVKP